MASNKKEKTLLKKKACLLGLISFFSLAVIFSVKSVFAYYSTSTPLSILASTIGDFDTGNADVNMMIYKETGKGTNVFVKSYAVPSIGYTFNDLLTTCSMPCDDSDSNYGCNATCKDGEECNYSFDEESKSFSITSNHKLTCKFYFNAPEDSDINVYVMLETDENNLAEKTYNSKGFIQRENIPAYGYRFVGYTCDNPVESVEYDAYNKKFIMETETKNSCYAYFEKYGSAELTANIHIQKEYSSNEYIAVETIPVNTKYKINSSKSICVNSNNEKTNAIIEYIDGYINIDVSEKQVCDVYLDIEK